jgi:RimJ/RimL family protein N-acetyltransferase
MHRFKLRSSTGTTDAATTAGNPASARVLRKCGFVQEGFLHKQYLKDGRFLDATLFALLKDLRRRCGRMTWPRQSIAVRHPTA